MENYIEYNVSVVLYVLSFYLEYWVTLMRMNNWSCNFNGTADEHPLSFVFADLGSSI